MSNRRIELAPNVGPPAARKSRLFRLKAGIPDPEDFADLIVLADRFFERTWMSQTMDGTTVHQVDGKIGTSQNACVTALHNFDGRFVPLNFREH